MSMRKICVFIILLLSILIIYRVFIFRIAKPGFVCHDRFRTFFRHSKIFARHHPSPPPPQKKNTIHVSYVPGFERRPLVGKLVAGSGKLHEQFLEETFLDVDDEKLRKDKTSSINTVTVVFWPLANVTKGDSTASIFTATREFFLPIF